MAFQWKVTSGCQRTKQCNYTEKHWQKLKKNPQNTTQTETKIKTSSSCIILFQGTFFSETMKSDNDQQLFMVSAEAKEDDWRFAKHTLLQLMRQMKDEDIYFS